MATEASFIRVAEKWKKQLNLQNETISYTFEDNIVQDDDKVANRITQAQTNSLAEYQCHDISVSKDWLSRATPESINEVACHEMVHVLTSGVWGVGWDIIRDLPKNKQGTYGKWFGKEVELATVKTVDALMKGKKIGR